MENPLQVTPDRLLQEIGRLTVTNSVLAEQNAALRREVLRMAGQVQAKEAGEAGPAD